LYIILLKKYPRCLFLSTRIVPECIFKENVTKDETFRPMIQTTCIQLQANKHVFSNQWYTVSVNVDLTIWKQD